MEINRREIYRYLGYGQNRPDQLVEQKVEDSVAAVMQAADCRFLYREYPLKLLADDYIDGTFFCTRSKSLSRNLNGCGKVLAFAATLGAGVDYLIQRYTRLEMSRAVILQAVSAAVIESYCNEVCGRLAESYRAQGWFLRPRFSPGYGDFSLELQKPLLGALDAGKRIGIKLTDSLLMTPSKSVSAVIGVSSAAAGCVPQGCEACSNQECLYKREDG